MPNHRYHTYWARKALLAGRVPHFPVRRWWPTDGLCDIEQVYFDHLRPAARVLDIGSGDLRVKRKFCAAGYTGVYHTQDVGAEFEYDLAAVPGGSGLYDAMICFDVIEHLPVDDGLGLLARAFELLTPGGVLLVQTPNGRCVRNPLATDMTHLHVYSVSDLWAYLTALGFQTSGYRVALQAGPRVGLTGWFWRTAQAFVATRLLGCDYTDNLALVARKPRAV